MTTKEIINKYRYELIKCPICDNDFCLDEYVTYDGELICELCAFGLKKRRERLNG